MTVLLILSVYLARKVARRGYPWTYSLLCLTGLPGVLVLWLWKMPVRRLSRQTGEPVDADRPPPAVLHVEGEIIKLGVAAFVSLMAGMAVLTALEGGIQHLTWSTYGVRSVFGVVVRVACLAAVWHFVRAIRVAGRNYSAAWELTLSGPEPGKPRGLMGCRKCGREPDPGQSSCPQCGTTGLVAREFFRPPPSQTPQDGS
jgi:hypothetical protein